MEENNDQVSTLKSSQKNPEGMWAPPFDTLQVEEIPEGITAVNVHGRHAIGALQGFGQLWKKTYRVRLPGLSLTAAEVMQVWKDHFPEFQPPGNRFYPPKEGIAPGKIMLIDSPLPVGGPMHDKPGIVPMNSGVMILYSDQESFSVMTPEGFPVAGWNIFSVFEEDGSLVAQVQSFERASDPIYEFGFVLLGGAQRQEYIWIQVLTRLAQHFGIQGVVSVKKECLDPKLQWAHAKRVWQNAGFRTTIYKLTSPFRWLVRLFK